jgi:hypothetical protein
MSPQPALTLLRTAAMKSVVNLSFLSPGMMLWTPFSRQLAALHKAMPCNSKHPLCSVVAWHAAALLPMATLHQLVPDVAVAWCAWW